MGSMVTKSIFEEKSALRERSLNSVDPNRKNQALRLIIQACVVSYMRVAQKKSEKGFK